MWRSFYEQSALLDLPLLAMGLFIIAFAVAVTRAWRKSAHDPRAHLPLLHDEGAAND